MPSRVVERDSNKNLEIDKSIRNCWKWEWLEHFVDGNPVRQTIRKIDSRGGVQQRNKLRRERVEKS